MLLYVISFIVHLILRMKIVGVKNAQFDRASGSERRGKGHQFDRRRSRHPPLDRATVRPESIWLPQAIYRAEPEQKLEEWSAGGIRQ